ncbi:MAG: GIY-YIG nuclease family protein [Kiritimatiellae bacterium]|nr:GIY-YIG nuclease family protein [Kiritimatiellia bacterium]
MKFTCVYLLQSEADPRRHYTGMTDDLGDRLRRHNGGEVTPACKHRPWRIRVAVAFEDRQRAAAFEGYLKTHSGRVFAARHF